MALVERSPSHPSAGSTRRRFLALAALVFVICYALIFGAIAIVHVRYTGFRRVDLALVGVLLALGAAGLVLLGWWLHEALQDRRMAAQLEDYAKQVRLLANHVPCAIWTTDADMVVTSAVGALMQAFGWPPERAIGRPYAEVVERPDGNDPGVEAHRRALAGEAASYVRTRHGRWLEVRIDPLRDEDGKVVGCVGVAVEFTKWRSPAPQEPVGGSQSSG